MSENEVIEGREVFFEKVKQTKHNMGNNASLKERVELFERELLEQMVFEYKSANQIANHLKVNRSTISRKLKQYGLDCIDALI
jgi:TyrR family helix-turn-helix protein